MREPISAGRRDYWVPLVLTAAVLLAGLFVPEPDFGWFAYAPIAEDGLDQSVAHLYAYAPADSAIALRIPQPFDAFGWWPVGALAAFLLTAAWYLFRFRAGNRPSPWRIGLLVVGGSAAILLLSSFGAASWSLIDESGFVNAFVLPLGALGLCGVAWAYFGTGRGRRVAGWLGGVLLGLVVSMLVAMILPGLDDLLVFAAGLLVLAWLERSVLLAAVTVLTVVASIDLAPTPPGLLPALVLLAGAIAALATRRGQWRGERPADTV
ncbi:hypothetical protein [Amycolatopsis magusensis]|uniref:hypothetical protein n=1 Tax=Amycolatopsis magusensis TaxID=882444 RepID=UPI0037BDA041